MYDTHKSTGRENDDLKFKSTRKRYSSVGIGTFSRNQSNRCPILMKSSNPARRHATVYCTFLSNNTVPQTTTTMATFANQISNLSALTSALGTFSRILELTDDDDSFQEGKKMNEGYCLENTRVNLNLISSSFSLFNIWCFSLSIY